MTASVTNSPSQHALRVQPSDAYIARLAAYAIVLAVLESGIPSPIPGVKPGLANIVTLIALERMGWRAAAWVSLLRIFGSSIVLGGIFSPGFALSLSGGIASLLVLALCQYLPRRHFGWVTISLLSALGHTAGQLLLARLWLIPHNGIVYLIPLLAGMALVFGFVNGVITERLLRAYPERHKVSAEQL
ncbi:Gx transporter family protein [Chitinibacter bivalviorum]|uniref:Gx transporter family protein n=1 Tax=Chitinibacter bivalviorum TaxID=2739434 RepID=A0A7H9BE94_9NEIS|nr:Gx transporter family protein [Chitinibacter bivalviorum]QLG87043.1 Gx transporter family protein [Chitinibacter bivalviorum]